MRSRRASAADPPSTSAADANEDVDNPGSIAVQPLTEERLGDYLRFFDEKAFTD